MQSEITLGAGDDGTALVGPLLHGAVLADGPGEGAHPQVAHEHAPVARAVEAGLVGRDPVALRVVLEVVVAARAGACAHTTSKPNQRPAVHGSAMEINPDWSTLGSLSH